MALDTVRIDVTQGAYVKIGDNVTALTAKERSRDAFHVVAQDAGIAAPVYGDVNRVNAPGLFVFTGPASDVYVGTPFDKVVELEIVRS